MSNYFNKYFQRALICIEMSLIRGYFSVTRFYSHVHGERGGRVELGRWTLASIRLSSFNRRQAGRDLRMDPLDERSERRK